MLSLFRPVSLNRYRAGVRGFEPLSLSWVEGMRASFRLDHTPKAPHLQNLVAREETEFFLQIFEVALCLVRRTRPAHFVLERCVLKDELVYVQLLVAQFTI